MIKEFKYEDLTVVNDLLKEFNYSIDKNIIENNKFINILLYDDIGIIVYDYIYDRIEIEYILVKEEYRNKLVATKLLNYVENMYDNLKNITLEVNVNNIAAIKFYLKNGFKKVSLRKNYYDGIDAILMIKEYDN